MRPWVENVSENLKLYNVRSLERPDLGEAFGTAADPGQLNPHISVSYLYLPKKGSLNQAKCGLPKRRKKSIFTRAHCFCP